MKKKPYQQPRLHTVNINIETLMQTASVNGVDGNAGLTLSKTGGSGPARGRESSDWFDDEE